MIFQAHVHTYYMKTAFNLQLVMLNCTISSTTISEVCEWYSDVSTVATCSERQDVYRHASTLHSSAPPTHLLVGPIEPLLGSHGGNITSRVGKQVTVEVRLGLEGGRNEGGRGLITIGRHERGMGGGEEGWKRREGVASRWVYITRGVREGGEGGREVEVLVSVYLSSRRVKISRG